MSYSSISSLILIYLQIIILDRDVPIFAGRAQPLQNPGPMKRTEWFNRNPWGTLKNRQRITRISQIQQKN